MRIFVNLQILIRIFIINYVEKKIANLDEKFVIFENEFANWDVKFAFSNFDDKFE